MNEVWVFYPASRDGAIDGVRRTIRGIATRSGWGFNERQTENLGGHPFLRGEDARNLYRRMHRASVAVLSLQAPKAHGPLVSTRPRPAGFLTEIGLRYSVSLRQYCRHKAFFLRLRSDRDREAWVKSYLAWAAGSHCGGTGDPRSLPLHAFGGERHWSRTIATPRGRDAFDEHFGPPACRVDARRLRWTTGPEHGHEALHVAGCPLPTGFHWDVKTDGEPRDFATPTEIWRIKTYVNVAPDCAVRGREPFAKQVPVR